MLLFHGSNQIVSSPRLLKNQRALDFGKGFYTTSDMNQASLWAKRTTKLRGTGNACVSIYEMDDFAMKTLKVLRFERPDRTWLAFVSANRKELPGRNQEYDLVIGPVADDQTRQTIVLYLDGYLDEEAAIKRLLPQKLKDQYTFKTELALSKLIFSGGVSV